MSPAPTSISISFTMLALIGFIVLAAILAVISVVISAKGAERESEELLRKRFEEQGFTVRDPEDTKK